MISGIWKDTPQQFEQHVNILPVSLKNIQTLECTLP